MGFIQKDAIRSSLLSYLGLVLGYLNKGVLFIMLLSTDEIGLVNLILAVGVLLAQLSNLGSIYAIWKFFPFFRNAEKRHYGFLLMNMLIALVGVIFFLSLVIVFRDKIGVFYAERSPLFLENYYLIIPVSIATVYFLLFENYLRGLNKNILPVFLNEFLLRFIVTILLIIYALSWISFEAFLIIFSFIHFIPTVILLFYLIRIKEITFSISSIVVSKRFKKIILKFSLFSYFNTIGTLVVMSMDTMMIASMIGLKATGVYTTVIYLISALQIPYRSLIRICSPLISVYWKERKIDKIRVLYKQVSSISLIVGLYFFGLIWINRNELFSFLPEEFMEGIFVFLFIMIGRLVDMYCGLNGLILSTSKKYKSDLFFTTLLLVSVFLMNLWLIPLYGITGAAISTGIALVVYNVGRVVFVYIAFRLHPFETSQLKVVALFFILLFGIQYFLPQTGNVFITIILNAIVYSLLFIGPMLIFKWNKDFSDYWFKGYSFLRSTLSGNKKYPD